MDLQHDQLYCGACSAYVQDAAFETAVKVSICCILDLSYFTQTNLAILFCKLIQATKQQQTWLFQAARALACSGVDEQGVKAPAASREYTESVQALPVLLKSKRHQSGRHVTLSCIDWHGD